MSTYRIELSWQPVLQEFVHGHLLGYKVQYQLTKESGRTKANQVERVFKLGPSAGIYVVERLKAFAVYRFRVAAFNSKGTGAFSEYVEAGL